VKQQTIRDFGFNKMLAFSVDGSTPVARRAIVATENCNKCHAFLSLHGGNRNNAQYCSECHNPNATAASPAGSTLPPQAIDFRTMVHKIHTGEELTTDYSIGTTSFNDVVYPGDRRNCTACHINNSQELPLPDGLLPVVDPRGLLNPDLPTTAACTGCHTTVYAASHALANTTRLGESCAACHGTSADFSVDKVHAH
jgi:OmcA/MtrC family decaheme c-type cytochrome